MKLFLICGFLTASLFSQNSFAELSQIEKENEVVNFDSIKNVINDDELRGELSKKKKVAKKIKKVRKQKSIGRYNYPSKEDFWGFMSELWLIKNAQKLHWDFQKPDYGITSAFKNLLEKFGFYNKKVKLLIVKSPQISHFALPANPDEKLFILSLPFMRTLDLTKVEISLLLLEDFFRDELHLFANKVSGTEKIIGKNFFADGLKNEDLNKILTSYSDVIYKKGFNFQEQYKITKKMDLFLRNEPTLWNVYMNMLKKIDRLIKMNLLFKHYNIVYPSPELQIQWLTPKRKVL